MLHSVPMYVQQSFGHFWATGPCLQHAGSMRREVLFDGLVSRDGCVPFSVHVAESVVGRRRASVGVLCAFCGSEGEEVSERRGTFLTFRGSCCDAFLPFLISCYVAHCPGFSGVALFAFSVVCFFVPIFSLCLGHKDDVPAEWLLLLEVSGLHSLFLCRFPIVHAFIPKCRQFFRVVQVLWFEWLKCCHAVLLLWIN